MTSLQLSGLKRQIGQSYNSQLWRAERRSPSARALRLQRLSDRGISRLCSLFRGSYSLANLKARNTAGVVACSHSPAKADQPGRSLSTRRKSGSFLGQIYLTLLPGAPGREQVGVLGLKGLSLLRGAAAELLELASFALGLKMRINRFLK